MMAQKVTVVERFINLIDEVKSFLETKNEAVDSLLLMVKKFDLSC
jgi:hypothetical protein